MPTEAGFYGGGKEITCICNEGNITVTAANTVWSHIGAVSNRLVTLAAQIDKGDFVTLDEAADNTYDATHGVPVVEGVVAAQDLIIGICKSQPEWLAGTFPTASRTESSDWATMLANGEYRLATVEFIGFTSVFKAKVEGTTDITPGAPVAWDLSDNAFKDNGTVVTGAWSLHAYATNDANGEALIAVSHMGVGSTNSDFVGIDVVA